MSKTSDAIIGLIQSGYKTSGTTQTSTEGNQSKSTPKKKKNTASTIIDFIKNGYAYTPPKSELDVPMAPVAPEPVSNPLSDAVLSLQAQRDKLQQTDMSKPANKYYSNKGAQELDKAIRDQKVEESAPRDALGNVRFLNPIGGQQSVRGDVADALTAATPAVVERIENKNKPKEIPEISEYRTQAEDLTNQRDALDKQMADLENALNSAVDPVQRQQISDQLDNLLTQRGSLDEKIAEAEKNLEAEPDQWVIAAQKEAEKKAQYNALGDQLNQYKTVLGYATDPVQEQAIRQQMASVEEQHEALRKELNIPTEGERITSFLTSAGAGLLGNYTDTERSLYELGQEQRTRQTEEEIAYLEDELAKAQRRRADYVEAYGEDSEYVKSEDEWIKRYQTELDAYRQVTEAQEGAAKETADIADHFSEIAAEAGDKAKKDLNGVEQFLVDAGINGVQMLSDTAINLATGMPGSLVPLVLRSYGGGAQAARQAGADINQQVLFGAASAAVEGLTEKMFDGLAGIYGKGYADDMTELIIKKVAEESSPEVKAALTIFLGGAGEAAEEMVSGRLEPWLKAIYDRGDAIQQQFGSLDNYLDSWAETGYSMLVGFAMGFAGSSISEAQSNQNNGPTEQQTETKAEAETAAPIEQQTQPQTPQAEQQTEPQTTPAQQALLDTIGENISNSKAETIINDPVLKAEFEQAAGVQVKGTKSEQRAIVKNNADAVVNTLLGIETAPVETAPIETAETAPEVADTVASSTEETAEVNVPQNENVPTEQNNAVSEETVEPAEQPEEVSAWQQNNIENEAEGEIRERGESRNIRTDANRAEQLRTFKEQNPDMYKALKNDKVAETAFEIYDSQGIEGATNTLESAIRDAQNGKKLPIEMVVLHKLVCDELARTGQVERANRISSEIAAELTYAGRLGQANIILRSSSPTAKAEAFAKTLNRLISENNANVDETAVQDLINRYRAAETDEARDAIIDEATTAIAESSPTTFREALTAIRYLNMLGNFKTQFRNVLGNLGMRVLSGLKNRTLALEQIAANAVSNAMGNGDAVEQTNTLFTDSKLRQEALEYFKEDRDATLGEGKYTDVAAKNKAISDKKTIFKWNWKNETDSVLQKIADAPMRVLEKYRKLTNYAMDKGDEIFTKWTYTIALADYAKAQGYESLADIDADTLAKMRQHAIQQAQEATFRDTNAVSKFASTFDQNWGKVGKTIAQGVIPFRKTPANVGVRMWEYSPLGLVDAFVDTVRASKGQTDANKVLDDVAKSLSGSALTALGFMMAKAGLARGKNDDDKLEEYERNVQGLSDYSITLPWGSVSMDWFAPESAAFFVGVAAAEAFDDGAQADDFLTLLGSTSDIALNMSFLSGLQDSLDKLSSNNGDMGALPTFLLNSLISYGGQIATNSLLGQAEQASERYRQTSYSDKEGILPTGLQYTASKLTAKMPGVDYNQTDYIDAWGRKVDNGENVAGRIAEAFASPAYINEDRSTEIDDELKRLHEATQDKIKGSVLPTVAPRTNKVGDETLTPEEYEIYQTKAGQTAYKLVSDFINGDGYDSMSDVEKAEAIKELYTFAKDAAEKSVQLERGEQPEKTAYDKARSIKESGGMSWAEYYQTKEGRDMDGNGSPAQEETAQYLFENFPEDKAEAVYNAYYPDAKTSYKEYAEHSQEIEDSGFTREQYDALTDTVKEAKAGKQEWDSKGDNAVIDAVLSAVEDGLSDEGAELLIAENTSKYYANPFSALVDNGHSMQESMDILDQIDAPKKNKDGTTSPADKAIQQAELKAFYKEHPELEALISVIWDSMGYTGKSTKTWEDYKKSLK